MTPDDVPMFEIVEPEGDDGCAPRGAVCYPLGLASWRYIIQRNLHSKARDCLLLYAPDVDMSRLERLGWNDVFAQSVDGLRPMNESARAMLKELL